MNDETELREIQRAADDLESEVRRLEIQAQTATETQLRRVATEETARTEPAFSIEFGVLALVCAGFVTMVLSALWDWVVNA